MPNAGLPGITALKFYFLVNCVLMFGCFGFTITFAEKLEGLNQGPDHIADTRKD
jgi:hypothetical protein